jgi:hypothetical protein
MEIEIQQQQVGKIYIPFTVNDCDWQYQDTLEFDPNSIPSEDVIQQMITDKFNTWKEYVVTPNN